MSKSTHFEISGKDPNKLTVTHKGANGKVISSNSGFNIKTAYQHIKTEIRSYAGRFCSKIISLKKTDEGVDVWFIPFSMMYQDFVVTFKVKDLTKEKK